MVAVLVIVVVVVAVVAVAVVVRGVGRGGEGELTRLLSRFNTASTLWPPPSLRVSPPRSVSLPPGAIEFFDGAGRKIAALSRDR